jgi:putative oxidoreductase
MGVISGVCRRTNRPDRGQEPLRDPRWNRRGAIDLLERRAGQALLGATFIKLGLDAAVDPGARVDRAATFGVPNAELAVRANGAAMVAGGAALVLDKLPRLAALGLMAAMIPTTLAGHGFWTFTGTERKAHEIQFLKNVGLFGGLLSVLRRSC